MQQTYQTNEVQQRQCIGLNGEFEKPFCFTCELVTSWLIRGIQMGEMSEMGWLIGLAKHAIWADSFSYTCCYFQFKQC
jgi:hypothetical protein